MPRTITMTTLWTAAWRDSNVNRSCPGEHQLSDRPDVHHVISRRVDDATAAAYLADHDINLRPGQVLGAVPPRMSPDGYLVSTLVTDPDELAAFADLMAPDEQLGTVPAAGRPPILLTEAELGDLIDAHHRGQGDVLFHREGLPHYDVAAQNADREAWQAGRFDPTQVTAWTARLADERERGMTSQRLRVLSEDLTDDELMSVLAALPVIAREEQVRILRRGEHPIPDVVDHDYWIARPADAPVLVIRMHYTDGGAFQGAEVIPPQRHDPYLRDQELGWAIGVPYAEWMTAHSDLQTRAA
ncbi:DUF6879 family protein [Pseudonocardia sichuanensis]